MKEGEKKYEPRTWLSLPPEGRGLPQWGRCHRNGPPCLCEQLCGQKHKSSLSGGHDHSRPPGLLQCVCELFLAPVHSLLPWHEGQARDGQLLLFPELELTKMNCYSSSRPSAGSCRPSTGSRVPEWPHQTDPASDRSCQCACCPGGERFQRRLRHTLPRLMR